MFSISKDIDLEGSENQRWGQKKMGVANGIIYLGEFLLLEI